MIIIFTWKICWKTLLL